MIKIDEGYIKFKHYHEFKNIDIKDKILRELNDSRTTLYDLAMIGSTPEGIGFGNISMRSANGFIITGSATGEHRLLQKEKLASVFKYHIERNEVFSVGMTRASSEAMSHAAVYECHSDIKSVVHIHHKQLWSTFKNILPTTNDGISYGTPEMALALQQLTISSTLKTSGIIVMGGHEDGLISFAESLEEASAFFINLLNNLK